MPKECKKECDPPVMAHVLPSRELTYTTLGREILLDLTGPPSILETTDVGATIFSRCLGESGRCNDQDPLSGIPESAWPLLQRAEEALAKLVRWVCHGLYIFEGFASNKFW